MIANPVAMITRLQNEADSLYRMAMEAYDLRDIHLRYGRREKANIAQGEGNAYGKAAARIERLIKTMK